MAYPSYQIFQLDLTSGEIKQLIHPETVNELHYNLVLNDIGAIALSFDDPDGAQFDRFDWDDLIEIYRENPNSAGNFVKEATYLVRSKQPFVDDSGIQQLVIGGLSLEHLLKRRVINPNDDPLQAGGYSTKGGTADEVIRAYCREQIGDMASAARRISQLSIPITLNNKARIGERRRFDNLLTAVQEMARGRVDFEIVHTGGGALVMYIETLGADRTRTANYPSGPWVGFNILRGNVRNASLVLDRNDEANFAYLLGEGKGENRDVIEFLGSGTTDSPYNRCEFTVDVRRNERSSPTEILTQGAVEVLKHRMKIEFSFDPNISVGGGIYRRDWILGDTVTAYWLDALYDLRITEVAFQLSANKEDIQITLSNEQNSL